MARTSTDQGGLRRRRSVFCCTVAAVLLNVSSVLSYGFSWSATDPYWQPAPTTDYYGSGDVDLNGVVNSSDRWTIYSAAYNYRAKNMRMDVNGDQSVTLADVAIVNEYLNGTRTHLPAWWNELNRAEREYWVDKMLAYYQVYHNHSYITPWYECYAFADQWESLGGYSRSYAMQSDQLYAIGQTVFNVPVFDMGVCGGGHAVNCVLVGDDPRDWDSWVKFDQYSNMDHAQYSPASIDGVNISWQDQTQYGVWTNPQVSLFRPTPPSPTPAYNVPDVYNPFLVPNSSQALIFEKQRTDMSKFHDLHVVARSVYEPSVGKALSNLPFACFRLAACYSPSLNKVHLLFKAKLEVSGRETPGVFYAALNLQNGTVSGLTRLSPTTDKWALAGKIVEQSNGAVHALWLDKGDKTIHWRRLYQGTWSVDQTISSQVKFDEYRLEDYDPSYVFDVAVKPTNQYIHLFYIASATGMITERIYGVNAWSGDLTHFAGDQVQTIFTSDGTCQLVYVAKSASNPGYHNKWDLLHRKRLASDPLTNWWGATTIQAYVYSNGMYISPYNPTVERDASNRLLVAWERRSFTSGLYGEPLTSRELYRSYQISGTWQTPVSIGVPTSEDQYKPTITVVSNGTPVLTWWKTTADARSLGILDLPLP